LAMVAIQLGMVD